MAVPDDVIAWKDLATGGAVALSGVVAFVVGSFAKRMEAHEIEDKQTFKEIFDAQRDISKQIADGFMSVERSLNETHIKLLERISDVQQDKNG